LDRSTSIEGTIRIGTQELLLQRAKRELKIKLELEKANTEDQLYQEFDTNHAATVSDKE